MNSSADVSVPGRVGAWARRETTGGLLLVVAAVLALVWANSPWRAAYAAMTELTVGPAAIHLDLSLSTWAADGVLAIFFFVVGLELKHELVAGSLRKPREAAVPVIAAIGGVAVPSGLYVLVVAFGDPAYLSGWAIPAATDIAFALAVLAIFGKGLPVALRVFLLTLAVVDDLIAITIIAVAYTTDLAPLWLIPAAVLIAAFAYLARRRRAPLWAMAPIAVVAWFCVHEAGVHATVAGVLLGLVVPAVTLHGEKEGRAHAWEDAWTPWAAAVALPVFAFFAAGVTVVDDGLIEMITEPVSLGVIAGLVIGKVLGILVTTFIVVKVTPFRLPDGIGIRDLAPIGLLCGIGFTVALLIADLSFTEDRLAAASKTAVLVASLVCALGAGLLLRLDAKAARKADMNDDGVDDAAPRLIGRS